MYIRNLAMKSASEKVQKVDKTVDQKRVLYELLDARQKTVQDLSRSLNMPEERIRNILEQLK